jgi:peroxiredoxin Q/BCP
VLFLVMIKKFALVPLVLGLIVSAAEPPAVGRKAPDFELNSLSGTPVKLSGSLSGGPLVLIVLRGFPGYQCPYCNRQVQDFVRNAPALAGTRVLFVYPGPADVLPSRAREFAEGKALPANFELLLDPDYRFTNLYGLRWDAPGETAYPAAFILETDRSVRFAEISSSHGGRVTAAAIAEKLRESSK